MKKGFFRRYMISPVAGVIIVLFLGADRPQRGGSPPAGRVSKITGSPSATMININRVAAWYSNTGEQEQEPSTGNSGLYYPRGTSTAVFEAGILWTGKFQDGINPVLRTNGQSYNTGTKAGAILGIRTGIAEDPNAPDVRIWRIRRDYVTADLRQDAAEILTKALSAVTDGDIQAIRDQYRLDWQEWPWQKGAPFYDVGYLAPNGIDTLGAGNATLDWGEDADRDGVLDSGEDANANGVLDGETPGLADADQVIWFVCNDIGQSQPWACPETGIEEQATIWGYNRSDALGNVIFKRFRLIYKGTAATAANATIDSMYLCQWSDVDLGTFTDDLAGCDTALSLGYVYNGGRVDLAYADFGLAPPASGYDFLQGPLVQGVAGQDLNKNNVDDALDFAVYDLKRVGPGYINLPMTSFIYFSAGLPVYTDPPFTYPGALMWNSMMQGRPPRPQPPPLPPPIRDDQCEITTYMFSGDPATVRGWLDGGIPGHISCQSDNVAPPADRRIILASGPFTMALGDTQELVSAWVGGLGKDYLGSVGVMKFFDRSVQLAYNNLFSLPKPPDAPKVRVSELDREVMFDWEWDSVSIAKTENTIGFGGYRFEGYTVYQLDRPSFDPATAKRIANFDLANGVTTILQEEFDENAGLPVRKPVRFGSDNGVSRFLSVTTDQFRGRPLVNGQRFYFAVTAYNFLADTVDPTNPLRTLESTPQVITVVPEKPKPGTRFAYDVGDTVAGVTNISGSNDARVVPVIFNRARQSGEDLNLNGRLDQGEDANNNGTLDPFVYQVSFDSVAPATIGWSLLNTTTSRYVYRNIADFTGASEYRVPEEGFSLYVASPPSGGKTVAQVQYNADSTRSSLLLSPNPQGDFAVVATSLADISGGKPDDQDVDIRFTATGGWALRRGSTVLNSPWIRVPFEAWNIGRVPGAPQRRIFPIVSEYGVPDGVWNAITDTTVGGLTYRAFDGITTVDTTYPTGFDSDTTIGAPFLKGRLFNASPTKGGAAIAIWRLRFADLNQDGQILPSGSTATVRLEKYKAIQVGDAKRFTPALMTIGNAALARGDVQAVNVFPNPYYGVNRAETDRVTRFVTFSHLPDRATIRIFNLAGNLVRTIIKNDPPGSSQFLRWNLQNEQGLPVASGIYIVYVELQDANGADLGTKTLKVAIIQEQQFLRNF